MRALLTISAAVALAFLAAAPVASALTLQTNNDNAAVNGSRVAEPDDVGPNMNLRGQQSQSDSNGYTAHIGNSTVHFGMSRGGGASDGSNQWFLDSPASRTVPSQMH